MPSTSKHTNLLSRESSPYLLQHQHNPVDWHPWGTEAFERARAENLPIFLSIGYSTCYWCHVMERESFENEQVAAQMNERFVCIKVDREERPDVDQLYMTAVQVLTRHGGWPMSVFLMPDLKPFYGGTYFPPTDMAGRMGFVTLLHAVDDAWKQRRDQVNQSADELVEILRRLARPPHAESSFVIDEAFIMDSIERSVSDFDPKLGGFGTSPKFPRQTLLELLFAYLGEGNEQPQLRDLLIQSLDAMANGGIRDHLGGGFHRYSTDAHWLVPHFEIMLYDNAMLAWLYAEAFRQTGERRHAIVARGILDFILREMSSPDGAFYTAFDAEVDGREGQSYLWTPQEVIEVLQSDSHTPSPALDAFLHTYALDGPPNFADPHHGTGRPDQYVLHLPRPLSQVASDAGLTVEQLEKLLEPMRQKLLAHRQKRKQPLLDTKILTSWNALAIRAFAHAGRVLEEPRYTQAARRAADWLLMHHLQPDGTLLHASRPDRPGRLVPGFLDDYATLALALIEMGEDSGDETASTDPIQQLADTMLARFVTPKGGFYFTDDQADDLIVRQMVGSDSPLPSGNAMAVLSLIKLNRPEPARETLIAFGEMLRRQGEGMSALLQAALIWTRRFGPLPIEKDEIRDSHSLSQKEVVSMQAEWKDATRLDVGLKIAEGFHLNAHDASEGLIPTTLSLAPPHVAQVRTIDYPAGVEQSVAFQDKPLRIYAGEVTISIEFKTPVDRRGAPIKLLLHYQPCTDDACLQPATERLTVGGE